MPIYICAFILGSFHTISWLVSGLSCTIGAIIFAVYNHYRDLETSNCFLILGEKVTFDIVYAVSYLVVAFHFYSNEYRLRYSLFMHRRESVRQKTYKEFLKNVPIGVLILDLSDHLMFYNNMVSNIVLEKNPEDNSELQVQERIITNEVIQEFIEHFIPKKSEPSETRINLHDSIEVDSSGEPNKYIYTNNGEEYTYSIKSLKTRFQSQKCKALIFQDQSGFERLRKLD